MVCAYLSRAGRIWGRRNCNFGSNPGPSSCITGGCNGGLVCNSRTGTGVPPATLAEFTLSAAENKDWYDISLVDGYNLPMRIDNNKGCRIPRCAKDLGPNCACHLDDDGHHADKRRPWPPQGPL